MKGETIVVTSNEPWGDIWYSKQNYAYELSKTNRVYFLNPPVKRSVLNLFNFRVKTEPISESLTVVHYDHVFPYLNGFFNRLNNLVVSKFLNRWFKKSQGVERFIFWAFDPIRLYNPKLLNAKQSIFHCVDYFYFKHLGEKVLCQNVDYIFATSQLFLDNYSAFDKPKFVVPHGISSEEFWLDPLEKQKIKAELPFTDFGLYIGVIDHRMDFELMEKVITRFKDTPFVFVGPIRPQDNASFANIFEKNLYQNVHLLGPKHFKTLKYYVDASLFCLSLMDMTFHMNTVHHHKTLVYLNQGKPVFSFAFEEYKKLDEIIYLSNDGKELMDMMDRFLKHGEPEELKQRRIEHAKKFVFEQVILGASKLLGYAK